MHARILAAALLAFVMLLAPSRAPAYSGFTAEQGSAYAKLAGSTMRSNDFYDLSGQLNDRGEDLIQRAVLLYAQYAVLDWFTAIVDMPVFKTNAYANTNTATGIGDLRVELKFGHRFGNLHVAASVGPEFPTGSDDNTVQTDSGLNLVLPTGDGEFNVWNRVGISYALPLRSISFLNAWLSAGVGYNVRTDDFSDQVGFGTEIGTMWYDLVMLQVRLTGQMVPSDDVRFAGFIFGEGTEYVALGAGTAVAVPHTPLAVTLDWSRPIALQANVYGGSVFSGGVSASF